MRFFLIIAIVFTTSFTVTAEESKSIADKLVSLKEKIKTHFEDMPQLSFRQKIKVGFILKKHRKEIRAIVDEIRPNVVSMCKEWHQLLTREQLLKIMDFQSTLMMRTKGEKASIFLQKLDKEHRSQLLELVREIHKSDIANLEVRLNTLHEFKMNTLLPYFAEYLELTDAQQQKTVELVEKYRTDLMPLMVKLIKKVREVKKSVKSKLSLAQINFLEDNREKVFEEIAKFVDEL